MVNLWTIIQDIRLKIPGRCTVSFQSRTQLATYCIRWLSKSDQRWYGDKSNIHISWFPCLSCKFLKHMIRSKWSLWHYDTYFFTNKIEVTWVIHDRVRDRSNNGDSNSSFVTVIQSYWSCFFKWIPRRQLLNTTMNEWVMLSMKISSIRRELFQSPSHTFCLYFAQWFSWYHNWFWTILQIERISWPIFVDEIFTRLVRWWNLSH